MTEEVSSQMARLGGGIRSDIAEHLNPEWEELEGFLVQRGRLVRANGLKPINTATFGSRVTGIGEWRDRAW